jgi:type VI secretion system protein VasG
MINLSSLTDKLNALTKKSLEAAVGLCAERSHYNVEIEHWLVKLLESDKSELSFICDKFLVDQARLKSDLFAVLENLKTGNTHIPTFSPTIFSWLQNSWSTASLEYGCQQISSGILLVTLLNDPVLVAQILSISREFKKIDLHKLQAGFSEITVHSAESNQQNGGVTSGPTDKKPLQQFTTDLTEQAIQGKLDPVIGRNNEIRQVIDVLLRRRQNNPILVGEAGVGKTAVVEGLALRIAQNDVPDVLRNVHIHILDLALLQAGASVKGEFENRLKSVIASIKKSPHPIILFVDEAHNLVGAGNQSGQNDAANLLKPALARGELRTIAATTWSEYKKFFEKDAALTRRFQVVKVDEPNEETAIAMLRGLHSHFEKHHKVHILDQALVTAVRFSSRYLPNKHLPDKAISLLDTACAKVNLAATTTPAIIEDYQKSILQIEKKRQILQREQLFGAEHQIELKALEIEENGIKDTLKKLSMQWEGEAKLVSDIDKLYQKLELIGDNKLSDSERKRILKLVKKYKQQLQENESRLLQPCVDTQTIANIIANWTGIPVGEMLTDEVQGLLDLENKMNQRIIGQSNATKIIAESIRNSRANLSDPRKPIGVFLLLGSSGVGKTETAHALADLLYGGESSLTVINMSEFKEEHKVSLLTGSPPGYVGYGEGGVLTEAVRRKPYSIILLDEIEKAHRGVQDIFYQVFDKGVLMDGEGRLVDFKNTVILMTANVGSNHILQYQSNPALLQPMLKQSLLEAFKPAFLSRLTEVVYSPLDRDVLEKIVQLQLNKIEERLKQNYQASFNYNNNLVDFIVERSQSMEAGARFIERFIANNLLPKLSSGLLELIGNKKTLKTVTVMAQNEKELMVQLN